MRGSFRLSDTLEPGLYALLVVARDRLEKDTKKASAPQWIGFEVVR